MQIKNLYSNKSLSTSWIWTKHGLNELEGESKSSTNINAVDDLDMYL